MVKDIKDSNEQVSANDREMKVLRKYFSSCFSEDGKTFDIDKFKSHIGDKVDIIRDGYE